MTFLNKTQRLHFVEQNKFKNLLEENNIKYLDEDLQGQINFDSTFTIWQNGKHLLSLISKENNKFMLNYISENKLNLLLSCMDYNRVKFATSIFRII